MTRPAILRTKTKAVPRATESTFPTEAPPANIFATSPLPEPMNHSSRDLDTIRTLGQLLDDLELTRIANGNRIAALERDYGESLPHLEVIQKQLRVAEHLAELELKRAWRKHPLAPWAKNYLGAGEKSIARLVASIGDPGERPNVAKLWAYCGHGDPARSRKQKGMTQEELFRQGSPRAKKQTWLIATSLLKAGNRGVYDAARANVAERVHEKLCVRCGPSGHPAQPGSPWSDGHKHAHALRVTGKAFLKDLWVASRSLQASPADHMESEGAGA